MELRTYQIEAIEKVRKAYHQGFRKVILRLDCGSGKTLIAAKMCIDANKKGNEVLFLVHRKELLDQTYETFKTFGVDMSKIKIGMIKTVGNHLEKYNPNFIIADECNFSMSKTWRKVIDRFPNAWLLGLSATPCRLDGQALGDIYEKIIDGVDSEWLIKNKYLSPFDYYAPHASVLEYKFKGSDYDLNDVTSQLLKSKIYGDIEKYIDYEKKTIIYCPSIEFSKKICEKYGATHFDGNTPKGERKKIIEDFKSGKIKTLTNVDLVSFGFDVPDCDVIMLLRPTQSLALYIQQSMRGMRYKDGKRATIYDFVGNVYRHGMPTEKHDWTLTGRIKTRNSNGEPDMLVRQCKMCLRVYEGVASVCPYCGNDNGQTRKQIKEQHDAELERVEQVEKKQAKRQQGMANSYESLVEIGRQRNYKNPEYWARLVYNSRNSKKKNI